MNKKSAFDILCELEKALISIQKFDDFRISYEYKDFIDFLKSITPEEFRQIAETSQTFRNNLYFYLMEKIVKFGSGFVLWSNFIRKNEDLYFNWILFDKIYGKSTGKYNFDVPNWQSLLVDTELLRPVVDEIYDFLLQLPLDILIRIFKRRYYDFSCFLFFTNINEKPNTNKKILLKKDKKYFYNDLFRYDTKPAFNYGKINMLEPKCIFELYEKQEYPQFEINYNDWVVCYKDISSSINHPKVQYNCDWVVEDGIYFI